MRRFFAATAAAMVLLFFGVTGASAVPPLSDITTPVIDQVGALDEQEVQYAIQRVEDQTDFRLTVVFVESFDGMSGAMWSTRSAEAAGLNPKQDLLFAVATVERAYGSAYPNGTVIARNITSIEDQALPFLGDGEWTQAVVAYADAVVDVATDTPPASSGSHSSGSQSSGTPVDLSGLILFFKWVGAIALFGFLVFAGIVVRRKISQRREEQARQHEVVDSVSPTLADFDATLSKFNMEVDYISAEFPDVALEEIQMEAAQARETLTQAFRMAQDINNTERPLRERYTDAQSILESLKVHTEFVENVNKDFASLRKKAAGAFEWSQKVAGKVASAEGSLRAAVVRIEDVEGSFDSSALNGAHKAMQAAENALATGRDSLTKAQEILRLGRAGQAIGSLEKAEGALGKTQQAVRTVLSEVEAVLGAGVKAEAMLRQLNEDISWVQMSDERSEQVGKDLQDAYTNVEHFSNVDYASGDPVARLNELSEFFERFHGKVVALQERERQVAQAIDALPEAERSVATTISDALSYRNHHRTDVGSSFESQLNDLSSKFKEVDSSTDPVWALQEIRKIGSEATEVRKKMERKVSAAEDARRREERRRREEADNSMLTGLAVGYMIGSSSSSSSRSSDSFGGSGGSFGGSGGSFGGSGGSGGNF